ncbi:hypothetical protein FA13DRAFT_1739442, partial [Coprinellus micaceus]
TGATGLDFEPFSPIPLTNTGEVVNEAWKERSWTIWFCSESSVFACLSSSWASQRHLFCDGLSLAFSLSMERDQGTFFLSTQRPSISIFHITTFFIPQ